MKANFLIKVSLGLIVVGIVLTGIGYSLCSKLNKDIFKNDVSNKNIINQSNVIDGFENLEIDIEVADIKIIPSQEFKINLKYQKDQSISYKLDNNTLCINQDYKSKIPRNKDSLTNEINIFIPKGAKLSNLNIDTEVSDISLDGLEAKNISIYNNVCDSYIKNINALSFNMENDVGDVTIKDSKLQVADIDLNVGEISLENIKADELEVNDKVGGISLEKSIINNKLNLNGGIGDIFVKSNINKSADISLGTGDVEVFLENEENFYNYNLDRGIGEIDIDGKNYENDINIDNKSKNNISIKSSNGDIQLGFR